MNSEPTKYKFHDIYIERNIMKLTSLVNENTNSKIRLLITESQFKNLANSVLQLQEEKKIRNTHLIKTNSNAKNK
jgi:hypothetical protein